MGSEVPAASNGLLPMVEYDTGTGHRLFLPPSHPLVRGTPAAQEVKREWDRRLLRPPTAKPDAP